MTEESFDDMMARWVEDSNRPATAAQSWADEGN